MKKLNEYLQGKKDIIAIRFYALMHINKIHFCGPGNTEAVETLKFNNQGELCRDFGFSQESSSSEL